MKRSPLARNTPLKRTGPVKARRSTPRRREAPRWSWEEWETGNGILELRSGGRRCERCDTARGPFERHHRKRRRDGGDRLCNLALFCSPCHRWVTEHPLEARKAGWIVSVYADPLVTPMFWKRQMWVFLDDAGGFEPME